MISLYNAHRGEKCALYLRTNLERQIEGHSIDSQKEYLSNWARCEGMEVVAVYRDAGKSGYSISGRDGFQRMLNDVATGRIDIDYVMVSELSRFGRNAKDASDALSILQTHGVNLLYPGCGTEIEFERINGVGSIDFASLCRS